MKHGRGAMKQVTGARYSIGWFKLAECISRGEKERAIGLYRLLLHSFNDKALALQLQADMYLSFEERDTAIQHYKQAAQLYYQDKRYVEAAGVYEHIMVLQLSKKETIKELIIVYVMLAHMSTLITYLAMYASLIRETPHYKEIEKEFDAIETVFSEINLLVYQQARALYIAQSSWYPEAVKKEYLIACMTRLQEKGLSDERDAFVVQLRTINSAMVEEVVSVFTQPCPRIRDIKQQ
ncbi:MAG: hypothetical protein WBQ73_02620 [Candidatus Babeliales bacterium]